MPRARSPSAGNQGTLTVKAAKGGGTGQLVPEPVEAELAFMQRGKPPGQNVVELYEEDGPVEEPATG